MSFARTVHHIGTYLVLAAFALLIVPDVTAPTVQHLSLFTVSNEFKLYNEGSPVINYGAFGYCLRVIPERATKDPTQPACVQSGVGYWATNIIENTYGYHSASIPYDVELTVSRLTKVFVLIPVATAAAAVAFALALFSSFFVSTVASMLAAFVAAFSFALAFVATCCAFVAFGAIQGALANNSHTSTRGDFDVGIWALLAATICLVLGATFLLFTCCSGHHKRKLESGNLEKA
ncbi:hypothetical protein JX265_004472 [Neoarthrinium moseri]|uniref:Uncharacterized protein n=1 Tax=Neoarthrinium moseri TaxID=1658444 RepID=A0A9Q0ASG4_9PEZI|nr:uncharacterized protein JN550_010841 [Neoarthrinium moseri]KAI1861461.1 hypothetical protein JN550_010841 [Neoarthrinium moseri]KAI1875414.1 hypothetical protein JX265_004472 [Neoarthrinium moseri]